MKNKRILFILHLPPPIHGSSIVGEQIFNSSKIKAIAKCDFINLSTSRSLSEIGENGAKKWIRIALIYFKVMWKLLINRYDLVYICPTVTGVGFFKDALLVILANLFRRKTLIHQHNKGVSQNQESPVFDKIYRTIYKRSTVILLSQRLYPDIRRYVTLWQIRICPNGTKLLPNFQANTKKNEFHFLFLSNMIGSKGCIVLLEACKKLKERGCNFVCDFVGAESKEITADRFRHAINECGLEKMAVYHGLRYGDEKTELFKQASAFVFPTFYPMECFPVVLLEAMQYGLACISTQEGAIEDIVINEQTGFIVPRQDAFTLANRMEELLKNPDLCTEMGLKGYQRYLQCFTEEIFEERITTILKEQIDHNIRI